MPTRSVATAAAALPTLAPLHCHSGALTSATVGHRHRRRGPSIDLTIDSLDSSERVILGVPLAD